MQVSSPCFVHVYETHLNSLPEFEGKRQRGRIWKPGGCSSGNCKEPFFVCVTCAELRQQVAVVGGGLLVSLLATLLVSFALTAWWTWLVVSWLVDTHRFVLYRTYFNHYIFVMGSMHGFTDGSDASSSNKKRVRRRRLHVPVLHVRARRCCAWSRKRHVGRRMMVVVVVVGGGGGGVGEVGRIGRSGWGWLSLVHMHV